MPTTLADWEKRFAPALARGDSAARGWGSALLRPIPERTTWEEFIACVGIEWKSWKSKLLDHPSCLVILYCGLAFYEYDEHTFWPQFAKVIGSDGLPVNQQTEINGAFGEAVAHFRL